MAKQSKESIMTVGKDGLDVDAFQKQISDKTCKKLHIVDVYTAWCGPCLSIVPTLNNLQVSVDFFSDRCTITQVDRTLVSEFAERFASTSKPCFLFYRGGQEVNLVEGVKMPEILKFIHRNLPEVESED
ncbi:unnamed protein product [Prorocentrum cordatum]|uniref:Thioredoxin domain-containing protein n=2 Tax=Prorocentrum TaxID=2944 RepID=A0ABN9QNS3_9DINO|nr:unnamed protein product [Polarella glacialis]|mmetsp:Transcript_10699/g.28387  ORF Transcript_10699/g.28387 Transcript_10699/m.28387 type:complete len:129 (-) Transcript_10699:257-643(-)